MFTRMIYRLSLKGKLYLVFGISIAAILAGVTTGVLSYSRVQVGGPAYGVIEENMQIADNIAKLRANMAFVRTSLLTMVIEENAVRRESARESIEELADRIDELFKIIDEQLNRVGQQELLPTMEDARAAWAGYRRTMEGELIPHILAGRAREAMALARGRQSEQYETMSTATKEAVDHVRDDIPAMVGRIKGRSKIVQTAFIAGSICFITFFIASAFFFSRTIVDPVLQVSERSRRMSQGDFTLNGLKRTGEDEIGVMIDSFAAMAGRVGETAGSLRTSILHISSSSEELSATAAGLSRDAAEQAGQAKEVTEATNQMSHTITDVAQNAAQAAEAAKNSSEAAAGGREIVDMTAERLVSITETVKEAAQTIEALSRSSGQIGEIVNLIHTIADQTNLLALNAAIEAARAGEQGRGFAVVADEVRRLADRTTSATTDIEQKIQTIQEEAGRSLVMIRKGNDEVEKGLGLARSASQALETIVKDSSQVMDMVQRIAAATEEQSATAEEITRNMNTISGVIDRSSEATKQIQQAAQALAKVAVETESMMAWFKIQNGKPTPA